MKPMRILLALALGLSVSACAGIDTVSRNTPFDAQPDMMAEHEAILRSIDVRSFKVTVPETLTVNEANLYYPVADIVWRGEAFGNRHEQVGEMLRESLQSAVRAHQPGKNPVTVELILGRFHSLSQKTRYSIGGVHSIRFDLVVRDAATGIMIGAPRTVTADLRGYGGNTALEAERHGLTQRVRITRHLANVLAGELAEPGSTPRTITQIVARLESDVATPIAN